MKKQPLRRKAKKLILPVGEMIIDLAVWDFSQDEDFIRHTADQLAKAILVSYNMSNFGPSSFGLSDEEED